MTRCAATLLLAALAPSTTGCIAAVVPLAAGAALVKRHDSLERRRAAPPMTAAATATSDVKIVPTSLSSLPPPNGRALSASPTVAAFRSYAMAQAVADPGTSKRHSAIIPSASDLRVARSECRGQPVAVFIDLDPGRGTFDPLAPGTANAQLGEVLAALRASGIEIVWFSRLGAHFASAARAALVQGGLDPAGRDQLVLMRDIGERKQSLRDEVAKRFCPIAIVGDERADFDELYLYLKSPDAAIALDAMLGHGWFLASPFTPQTLTEPGATP